MARIAAPVADKNEKTQNRAERRRKYASQAQAAEYVGVTARTIRQWIAEGRITGYRINERLIRVDLNEIDTAMTPFGGAAK